MEGLTLPQLLVLPVGLDTEDLMVQVALQEGGDLTLLMLWGLEMGDLMMFRGLVRGGEPTVLDSAGLHVAEFLCWTWATEG